MLSELCGISFLAKCTGIIALDRAFHRAVAPFSGPRVWPRDPFGAGSCTSGFMLTLEAHSSSDGDGADGGGGAGGARGACGLGASDAGEEEER